MTVPRRLAALLAAAAAATVLAGCGGGGGGGAGADAGAPAQDAAVVTPVVAGIDAGQAAAVLGQPAAADPGRDGVTLRGYGRFGTPKDVFRAQVSETTATAGDGTPGTPTVPTTPTTGLPGGLPGIPTTPGLTPTPETPVQTPVALEADFDVSGEPVIAREGDAIPPDTRQFTVETIGVKSVVLKLSAGLLPDGTDEVTLDTGESITLRNTTAGETYRIKLVAVRAVN